MTFRVILQPQAERDIRAAARWIIDRSKSPATALRWARGIEAKIATLKSNPRRCPIDPDSDVYGEEVRVLLYGKRQGTCRVLFTIRGDVVHILTVRHSARRSLAEELEREESDEDAPGPNP
jgi:plasmid stabilization system protein ParE